MHETLTHRLILPGDANHHGTLYAGSLLRIALEAAYASAYRLIGDNANLVLRRVLNLECYHPVPIGKVIELRGTALHITRTYLVIGLIGTAFEPHSGPWMDGLMGFVQVDDKGRPAELPDRLQEPRDINGDWQKLEKRMEKLLRLR